MKTIVIGCGRLGAGLAQALCRRGVQVAVVDRDPVAFERLGTAFAGETVTGLGFDREVLLRAGIESADALAAVTSSDEVNLVAARLARVAFRVPRVAARIYDPGKEEVCRRLGLPTISHVTWGVSRMMELLCYSQLAALQSLGGGEVELMEVDLPQLLVGKSVQELTLLGEIQVVAITRQGKSMLPTLGTEFRSGDLLHLAVLASSAGRLRRLLGLQ